MGANLHKLMQGTRSANNRPVVNGNMAGHLDRINQNTIVANDTIVGYMYISHQEAILSNNGFEFIMRATAYGNAFADYGVITNKGFCFFTGKLQVLRNC